MNKNIVQTLLLLFVISTISAKTLPPINVDVSVNSIADLPVDNTEKYGSLYALYSAPSFGIAVGTVIPTKHRGVAVSVDYNKFSSHENSQIDSSMANIAGEYTNVVNLVYTFNRFSLNGGYQFSFENAFAALHITPGVSFSYCNKFGKVEESASLATSPTGVDYYYDFEGEGKMIGIGPVIKIAPTIKVNDRSQIGLFGQYNFNFMYEIGSGNYTPLMHSFNVGLTFIL